MIPKYILLKEKLSEAISQKKYPLFSKLPTELELAAEYGVSRATVRQALALLEDDGIIDKHWGSGNTVIGSYTSAKRETVAVIVPHGQDDFISEALDEIRFSLNKEDLSAEVFESYDSQQIERGILEMILKDIYAGIILYPSCSGIPSINTDLYQKLLRRQLPLLFLYNEPSDMELISSVKINSYECGYICARHFINKGIRSIGAVFRCNTPFSRERFRGFASALRDSNIPLSEDCIYWLGPNQPVSDLFSFLPRTKGKISALVCDDTEICEAVNSYCRSHGLTIPGDLALVSCEEAVGQSSTDAFYSHAALSGSMGKEASSAFLSIKKDGSCKQTAIGYRLIQGQSS